MFKRYLAGDDGGALICPSINNLNQVGLRLPVHGRHLPIVKQQDVGLLQNVKRVKVPLA